MKKAILATKVGMTQIFNEDGVLTPVTVLQAGPCVVTQVKTEENDGYKAVQVGFVDKREKLVTKPVKGHFDKAGVAYKRYVREFRLENAEEYSVKDEIKADIFAAGDKIDATAISKGKGFQGAIKRHGQHRGPMAHGSKFHRHQGSNGSATTPGRVFKGKGMPANASKTVNQVMLDEIRRERALELYMEGFRCDDLKRWGIAEENLNESRCGAVVGNASYPTAFIDENGNATSAFNPAIFTKGTEEVETGKGKLPCVVLLKSSDCAFTKGDYLWAIPRNQINLNSNLVQNPGY